MLIHSPYRDDVNKQGTYGTYQSGSDTQSRPVIDLSECHVHLLPPTIHGFSLCAKRWGEFLIDNLKPIEWTDRAFQHLVIPDSYRRIVQSLVSVHASELKAKIVSDVVEGKGNGLIIALYGPPGTGKVRGPQLHLLQGLTCNCRTRH